MPVRTIFANGRAYRLGGVCPPRVSHPAARLEHFVHGLALPVPPPAVHYNQRNPLGVFDALGNDEFGDCAFAGLLHLWDIWNGTARATKWDALNLYKAVYPDFDFHKVLAGDENADPGADLQTVLAYVKAHGMWRDGRGKIAGWVKVNPANIEHVKLAIWLFGGLYGGMGIPDALANDPPAAGGFIWDLAGAPDAANGHCIPLVGFNDNEIVCATWGLVGGITPRAVAYYFAEPQGGELYAPLSPDWVDRVTARAPNGFRLDELQAYLRMVA